MLCVVLAAAGCGPRSPSSPDHAAQGGEHESHAAPIPPAHFPVEIRRPDGSLTALRPGDLAAHQPDVRWGEVRGWRLLRLFDAAGVVEVAATAGAPDAVVVWQRQGDDGTEPFFFVLGDGRTAVSVAPARHFVHWLAKRVAPSRAAMGATVVWSPVRIELRAQLSEAAAQTRRPAAGGGGGGEAVAPASLGAPRTARGPGRGRGRRRGGARRGRGGNPRQGTLDDAAPLAVQSGLDTTGAVVSRRVFESLQRVPIRGPAGTGVLYGWDVRAIVAAVRGDGWRASGVRVRGGRTVAIDPAHWRNVDWVPVLRVNRRGKWRLQWVDRSGQPVEAPGAHDVEAVLVEPDG